MQHGVLGNIIYRKTNIYQSILKEEKSCEVSQKKNLQVTQKTDS